MALLTTHIWSGSNLMLERIWLLTIEALDEMNNPTTLRFSSGDYTSNDGFYYDLRIKQPALYSTSAYAGSVVKSGSSIAYGETVLVNTDGGLDYLADYAVDGRVSVLSILDEYGTLTEVIRGTVSGLIFEEKTVSVKLRDPQAQLEQEHPNSTYLGDNVLPLGLEGVANDIKGREKPRCYGRVSNIEPILVNTSELAYEYHDYTISPSVPVSLLAVYDRGVALTAGVSYATESAFLASSPAPSTYDTYSGYFKLGSAPTGTITCDVESSKNLPGDVLELLLNEQGYQLETDSKTILNDTNYKVGIFISEGTPTARTIDLISQSLGGYWWFDALDGNVVKFKRLIDPSTEAPVVTLYDYQIKSISRESTGAGGNGLPVFKVRLKADRVHLVQNDLAGSVDADRRARLAVEWREGVFEDPSVRTRHPLSEEMEVETCLCCAVNATVEAERVQGVLGKRRDIVSLTTRLDQESSEFLEIGNVIRVESYKLGYSSGRNFLITGYTLDARLSRADIQLFG